MHYFKLHETDLDKYLDVAEKEICGIIVKEADGPSVSGEMQLELLLKNYYMIKKIKCEITGSAAVADLSAGNPY